MAKTVEKVEYLDIEYGPVVVSQKEVKSRNNFNCLYTVIALFFAIGLFTVAALGSFYFYFDKSYDTCLTQGLLEELTSKIYLFYDGIYTAILFLYFPISRLIGEYKTNTVIKKRFMTLFCTLWYIVGIIIYLANTKKSVCKDNKYAYVFLFFIFKINVVFRSIVIHYDYQE